MFSWQTNFLNTEYEKALQPPEVGARTGLTGREPLERDGDHRLKSWPHSGLIFTVDFLQWFHKWPIEHDLHCFISSYSSYYTSANLKKQYQNTCCNAILSCHVLIYENCTP